LISQFYVIAELRLQPRHGRRGSVISNKIKTNLQIAIARANLVPAMFVNRVLSGRPKIDFPAAISYN
jgi:hypothetical protein